MKILFFIAGIFFISTTYCQDNFFVANSIQQYFQKRKLEQVKAVFRNRWQVVNIAGCWGPPLPNFNFCWSYGNYSASIPEEIKCQENYMKAQAKNWFFNYENTVTVIVKSSDRTDRWKTEPVSKQRLKELRDILEGSKSNYRSYFD